MEHTQIKQEENERLSAINPLYANALASIETFTNLVGAESCAIEAIPRGLSALHAGRECDPLFEQLRFDEFSSVSWDYHQQSYRYGLHGLIKYPAMMVPQMQGDLLDAVLRSNPDIVDVLDPFVGVGTTLVECIARDLNFTGVDINPLAILACQAKSGPFLGGVYSKKVEALLKRLSRDRGKSIDVEFPERRKWFSTLASSRLSRIRRAICGEASLWARRLMWIAFAETVRAVSNSRGSTYKLHLKPSHELAEIPSAFEHFRETLHDSVSRVRWHEEEFGNRGILRRGRITRSVEVFCSGFTDFSQDRKPFADLIITSPPYGDNRSTVSYGQFSYLQLRWIPPEDLPRGPEAFRNAYLVDGRSLGGSWRGSLKHEERLSEISAATRGFINEIKLLRRQDLLSKSLAFLRDYENTLKSAASMLRPGGYALWTIGDRSVGGVRLPLGNITAEFLESFGMPAQGHIARTILQKRTPQRNTQGHTMNDERVLITKKTN